MQRPQAPTPTTAKGGRQRQRASPAAIGPSPRSLLPHWLSRVNDRWLDERSWGGRREPAPWRRLSRTRGPRHRVRERRREARSRRTGLTSPTRTAGEGPGTAAEGKLATPEAARQEEGRKCAAARLGTDRPPKVGWPAASLFVRRRGKNGRRAESRWTCTCQGPRGRGDSATTGTPNTAQRPRGVAKPTRQNVTQHAASQPKGYRRRGHTPRAVQLQSLQRGVALANDEPWLD